MTRATAAVLGIWMGVVAMAGADELRIGQTAILSGSLPTGTGWQVEMQQPGGSWAGTGVMVAGRSVVAAVRMDGWPGDAAYRFQRVDGAATVTAALGSGWCLAGSVTAAGRPPVVIQKSEDLAEWSPREVAFPALDRSYVRVLESPGTRRFFRAASGAAGSLRDGSATTYGTMAPYNGAAGYGPVYADMPQIFKDGYITAIPAAEFNRGGLTAAAAGECYELSGPFGRTTVIVSDSAPAAPPGTVDAGRGYFDLGPAPFSLLNGGQTSGIITLGSRLVPAPVVGNLKLYVTTGSNLYYVELRPFNHRAGVNTVEFLNGGSSTWVTLPRQTGNSFVFLPSGSPVTFPVQVRMTSRFGEVVTFSSITSLNGGQIVTGPAQFNVFPEQAPATQRRILPVYQDVLSNVPGDSWSTAVYGGASVTAVDTAVKHTGTASLRISSFSGFSGVNFLSFGPFPRPQNGVLKLAVRSASPVAAGQVQLKVISGTASSGTGSDSAFIPLPALTTGWQVLHLPLEASGTAPVVSGFTLVNGSSATLPDVSLDDIEFLDR
ncbi:MAG: hypothetical protein EOP87_09550 [Verrucomicrobiaceae bacterium]|nr:MAG: hypothetical protein EOP87_09550 [Verrucomicrobiaceae bacterium]